MKLCFCFCERGCGMPGTIIETKGVQRLTGRSTTDFLQQRCKLRIGRLVSEFVSAKNSTARLTLYLLQSPVLSQFQTALIRDNRIRAAGLRKKRKRSTGISDGSSMIQTIE